MNGRKRYLTLALVVLLIGGAASAALLFRLRGSGSSSGLNTSLTWAAVFGTNDDSGQLDPTGFGWTSPTRAAYDIAESSAVLSSGQLAYTGTDVYSDYRVTVRAQANPTSHDLVISGIEVTDDGSADPFPPGTVTGSLSATSCGKAIGPGAVDREVDLGLEFGDVPDAASWAFTIDVLVVPVSDFTGSCPSTF